MREIVASFDNNWELSSSASSPQSRRWPERPSEIKEDRRIPPDFAPIDLAQCADNPFAGEVLLMVAETQEKIMFRIAKVALFAMALFAGAASTPAFAVSARGVAAGEAWARQMLPLMDADKDGRVSRHEWMRFMEAEFDRLDVDHNGYLTVQELARFPSPGSHPGPHR